MTELGARGNAASLDSVLNEFDARKGHLGNLCRETRSLIEKLLANDAKRIHSIQDRVKGREKLASKYSDPGKSYLKLADITDLVGLRIITYYEDDIDNVAETIKREFLLDLDSVDKRLTEPDRFGYYALNLVCAYTPGRLGFAEYKAYSNDRFEIQVTSILRHAWSEIDHDWYDMKEKYPDSIKRRFYRLAALLEIAEQEFVEIRKSKKQIENVAAARVEAEIPNVLIENASLRAFIDQEPLVRELDVQVANILGAELSDGYTDRIVQLEVKLLSAAHLKTVEDIRRSLNTYRRAIPEYVESCRALWRGAFPTASHLEKGVSIFHLAFLLLGEYGAEAVRKTMTDLNLFIPPKYPEQQVAISQPIISKYNPGGS